MANTHKKRQRNSRKHIESNCPQKPAIVSIDRDYYKELMENFKEWNRISNSASKFALRYKEFAKAIESKKLAALQDEKAENERQMKTVGRLEPKEKNVVFWSTMTEITNKSKALARNIKELRKAREEIEALIRADIKSMAEEKNLGNPPMKDWFDLHCWFIPLLEEVPKKPITSASPKSVKKSSSPAEPIPKPRKRRV